MNFYNFFISLCAHEQKSPSAVVQEIGLTKSSVSGWKNEKAAPTAATKRRIADYFNIPFNLFDKSEWTEEDVQNAKNDIKKRKTSNNEVFPKNIISLPKMVGIPLVGSIACGTPITAEENIEDYIRVPSTIQADFALTCKGDSMVNARILDGDIVFIRQQPDVENGEIAAVLIGDEATLKRVYKTSEQIMLMAENPIYPPLVYSGESLNEIRILGKAVSFISTIK